MYFWKGLLWDMNTTLMFRHVKCSHMVLVEEAYFDTIGKSLTLLYSQCLVWLGCGFCPMLPVLGVVRNILMYGAVCSWGVLALVLRRWGRADGLPFWGVISTGHCAHTRARALRGWALLDADDTPTRSKKTGPRLGR